MIVWLYVIMHRKKDLLEPREILELRKFEVNRNCLKLTTKQQIEKLKTLFQIIKQNSVFK